MSMLIRMWKLSYVLAYRKYLKFWFMYFDIEGHSILDVRVGQPSNGSCPGK